jgi:hypothetical protein
MTTAEKEAILGYLEFALTNMVEALEVEKIINGSPQVGAVYDAAYDVLSEMENLLTEHQELMSHERKLIK